MICPHLHPRALALALALGPAAVYAQGAAAADATMRITIQAQPLAQALNEWARQTQVPFIAQQGLLAGKNAPAVSGTLTPGQALDRLLAGSGLMAVREGGAVVIRAAPVGDAVTLAEVTVAAQGMGGGTTEGTGSYTTRSTSTATGLDLSPRETPQSVSVITRQRIEDQALVSVVEALRSTPGVSVKAQDRGRSEYFGRGFSILNYQIDGMPTIFDANIDIDSGSTAIYDRVEVVRGATGLSSGAGNPAATVNLVRKHADSEVFTGSVVLEAGSWNRHGATVDLTTPLNADSSVRARVVASYRDQDGFMDFEQTKTRVLYGIVDADLGNRTRFSLGASGQYVDRRGTYWGGLPLWYADGTRTDWGRSRTTATREKWHVWDDHSQSVFASLDHRLDGGWSIRGNAQYLRGKEVNNMLWLSGLPDRSTGLGMSASPVYYLGRPRQHQVNIQTTGPFGLFGREHELTAGAVYMRGKSGWDSADLIGTPAPIGDFNNWDGSYPEPVYGPTYVGRGQTETQSAVYAAARLNVTDPLKLIAGTRITRFHRDITANWGSGLYTMREPSVFTPYLGVLYDINDHWTAYASYTSIFSPQSLRDRNGGYLDPLEGRSYEAGVKSEFFGGKLDAAAAVFRIEQENFGVRDGDATVPGTADPAYRSAKGVKSQGYELEITGRIHPRWDLSLSWTQFSARDRDGTRVNTRFPSRMLKLFTKYELSGALSGLSIGGSLEWQGSMPDLRANPVTGLQENVGQSAYAIVGLMARYQINKSLSVQANIYNLLDKKYYESSWGTFTYGEPRRILVGLKYDF